MMPVLAPPSRRLRGSGSNLSKALAFLGSHSPFPFLHAFRTSLSWFRNRWCLLHCLSVATWHFKWSIFLLATIDGNPNATSIQFMGWIKNSHWSLTDHQFLAMSRDCFTSTVQPLSNHQPIISVRCSSWETFALWQVIMCFDKIL